MRTVADDGVAVGKAREALREKRVPEEVPWRSTVVKGDQGGWVVRTWTSTATGDRRPSGPPDFVHYVAADFTVAQEHPR